MGFVRIKKIKGSEYGYLVENNWTSRGSRQKVVAYLGKIIKPVKTADIQTPEIKELSYSDAIRAIAKWTLLQHRFQEGTQSILMQNTVLADIGEGKFLNKNNPAVIAMNEGFLCNHTFEQALGFIPSSGTEEIIGKELANILLEAGLSVPHDVFVQVFEKIMKQYSTIVTL